MALAYREAVSGRPGPVHLTIPSDVSEAIVDDSAFEIPRPSRGEPAMAPPRSVEAALDLLERAERPAVIAGSGIWWSRGWDALSHFIELTQLSCFTSTWSTRPSSARRWSGY